MIKLRKLRMMSSFTSESRLFLLFIDLESAVGAYVFEYSRFSFYVLTKASCKLIEKYPSNGSYNPAMTEFLTFPLRVGQNKTFSGRFKIDLVGILILIELPDSWGSVLIFLENELSFLLLSRRYKASKSNYRNGFRIDTNPELFNPLKPRINKFNWYFFIAKLICFGGAMFTFFRTVIFARNRPCFIFSK